MIIIMNVLPNNLVPRNSEERVKRILNNSVLYGEIQHGQSSELEWTTDEKYRQRGYVVALINV